MSAVARLYGERTDDLQVIQAFLCRDRLYGAQALCNLEQPERCRGAVARVDGAVAACAVLFRGEIFDGLTLAGESDAVLAALEGLGSLPRQFWLWAREEHLAPLSDVLQVGGLTRMLRMTVTQQTFRAAPRTEGVRRLTAGDYGTVERLYRHTPGVVFRPEQLTSAIYYGVFVSGTLVAAAGTHGLSRRHGLAVVGNVLTHPSWRNRGYAGACTSVLTADLLRRYGDVVLNVAADNAPAKRVYTRLGYTVHCRLVEVQVGHTRLL